MVVFLNAAGSFCLCLKRIDAGKTDGGLRDSKIVQRFRECLVTTVCTTSLIGQTGPNKLNVFSSFSELDELT